MNRRTFWRNNKTWHLSTGVYSATDCGQVIGWMKGPLGGPVYDQLEEHNLDGRKLCRKCFPDGYTPETTYDAAGRPIQAEVQSCS
jgi:hypothetical protein